jgi:hypothetical protein
VGSINTNQEGINYAHHINKQFLHHNIYERSELLLQEAKYGSTNAEQILYQLNEMDKFVTTMLNAEKIFCKKKNPGLWTPAVHQSNQRIQYYNIRLKSERHRIYATERLKDIVQKMDDNNKQILLNNTKNLESSLKQAIQDHNIFCKNNNVDRSEYLGQLIEVLRERKSSEHVTIKQILQRETSCNDFRTIKHTLNPRLSKGVQHLDILVVGETDKWVRITDQQLIEDNILKRNKQHFGQAHSTPFGISNLQNIFGYLGINDTTIQLLENHIIPPECGEENEYIQMVVNKLSGGKIIEIHWKFLWKNLNQHWINGMRKRQLRLVVGTGHYKLLNWLNVFDLEKRPLILVKTLLKYITTHL